ncbi:isopentenyl-diphosphate Delta-isomerase [Luteimicrobium album]|uniref:Isopentenyl-diphosphate Delta-isomerase n=1 Tax=Luteimicrobium album TaxID=1054550 RepID=A0ABQ6I4V2_9MICO|nr:isopentenyl-diphosphate Delta-isomerase [Luteimicrobium album]
MLVDDAGEPCGTAPRDGLHGRSTPRHLAFSCHVSDASGLVLVTRRALAKRSWPGVWTNAFCGHPRPGEPVVAAVLRRGADELGLTFPRPPRVVLPAFSYRAVDDAGTEENELCPVLAATLDDDAPALSPDPAEVADWRWVSPDDLARAVTAAPWAFSPWLVAQLAELRPAEGATHARR